MTKLLGTTIGRLAILAMTAAGIGGMVNPIAAAAGPDMLAPITVGLVDQDGRPLTAARLAGRFVLVNFIFTGCGSTCPTQTAEIAKFDAALPPAVRARLAIVSISVDPANDSPAVLKRYAGLFHADRRRWTFASGDVATIARIAREFAAFRPGDAGAAFHTSDVRLFDLRHRMIQRYASAPLAERQLRADLMTLAAGAR